MYCNSISIDTQCFLDRGNRFEDRFGILEAFDSCKSHLHYRNLDLGPDESFYDFAAVKKLVAAVARIGFFPRLLTTGRYFTDRDKTIKLFVELKRCGLGIVCLRLDSLKLRHLEKCTISTFVTAAAAIAQSPYIRFDLGSCVPEEFYDVLRTIEEQRFYTHVFFMKKRRCKTRERPPSRLLREPSVAYRMIVANDGAIWIRPENRSSKYRIGSAAKQPLPDIIRSISGSM